MKMRLMGISNIVTQAFLSMTTAATVIKVVLGHEQAQVWLDTMYICALFSLWLYTTSRHPLGPSQEQGSLTASVVVGFCSEQKWY